MKLSLSNSGFALPTILIVSVVMLTVLMGAVNSTSSTSAALKAQYYNQTARDSADSGLAFAQSCLQANNGVATWSDGNPLRVNTDCFGIAQGGISCPDNSVDFRCAVTVSNDSKMVSNFSVGSAKTKINGWKQISSSNNHTCAIAYDSKLYCWGYNGNGQLGNGTKNSSNVPIQVDDSGVLAGKNIRSVAVGGSHTCAIAYDSQTYCWGANTAGQLGNSNNTDSSVPVLVTNTGVLLGKSITAISAGISHTCVIASDSLVYCWGSDSYGQLGDDATIAAKNLPVAVNMTNGTSALYGLTVRSIASGGYHNCAIASNSLVYCWGYNLAGQLGDNTTVSKGVPVAVNMTNGTSTLYGKTVRSITANAVPDVTNIGYGHTCVVASDGSGHCWGYNAKGQVGNNSTTNRLVPGAVVTTGVLSGKTLLSISASSQSTCAIASDSLVYCWGYNNASQLGNGSSTDSLVPVLSTKAGTPGGSAALYVASGGFSTCVIASDNQAYCWGLNTNGQLGDNSTVNKTSATVVVTDDIAGALASKITIVGTTKMINSSGNVWRRYTDTKNLDIAVKHWNQISVGTTHACGVDSNSQAYCWGVNTNGRLGNNSTTQSNIPVAVNTTSGVSALYGKSVKAIAAGGSHTCAISTDNLVYCWGLNTNGQIGDNSTTQRLAPVLVNGGSLAGKAVIAIATGSNHTCALTTESIVSCWGLNTSGQVGDNTIVQKTVPTAINMTGSLSGKTILSITTGSSHTCAVATDGTAHCWGLNANGQIGDNSSGTNRQISVAVNTAASSLLNKTVRSMTAGASHTCAIASDNLAHCWGLNGNGQLGDNSVNQRLVAVLVNTAANVSDLNTKFVVGIAAGSAHTCAVTSDGGASCWGLNISGQLGNRTLTQSQVPLSVYRAKAMNGSYAADIELHGGGNTTCSMSTVGASFCWGAGTVGQLGNNDILDSSEPLSTQMPSRYSIGL